MASSTMNENESKTSKKRILGVLGLQGAFSEHVHQLQRLVEGDEGLRAAFHLPVRVVKTPADLMGRSFVGEGSGNAPSTPNPEEGGVDLLVLPGGESTAIMLACARVPGLREALADFINTGRPVWGTCAGLILLAGKGIQTGQKKGGQELLGGLDIAVKSGALSHYSTSSSTIHPLSASMNGESREKIERTNAFGAQLDSFVTDLEIVLPPVNLTSSSTKEEKITFPGVFIRAPIIESVGPGIQVLSSLPPQKEGEGRRIVAVRQGNILGTSFHPELTGDGRMHMYFLSFPPPPPTTATATATTPSS